MEVSSITTILFCDNWLPGSWRKKLSAVHNLFHAKGLSLLLYDICVPYDTDSRGRLTKAGYPKDFFDLQCALRDDVRNFVDRNKMTIDTFRKFSREKKPIVCGEFSGAGNSITPPGVLKATS